MKYFLSELFSIFSFFFSYNVARGALMVIFLLFSYGGVKFFANCFESVLDLRLFFLCGFGFGLFFVSDNSCIFK